MDGVITAILVTVVLLLVGVTIWLVTMRNSLRESKNYERGLKMIPLLIHLPPSSEDVDAGGRDKRDLVEETISQAQIMYNIISSTATKGFRSKLYGQRHMSFEIVARDGLVYYYAVVPSVLVDVVRQAVAASYPTARLEEMAEHTVFSKTGRLEGTLGGEFTLKKHFAYPISTYLESKRDASRALLDALSKAGREDGIGIQILLRPAKEGWSQQAIRESENIISRVTGKKQSSGGFDDVFKGMISPRDIMEALWKPPETPDGTASSAITEHKELNAVEKATVESIQEKTRYPGYEVLIRVVVSTNTPARSQAMLANVVSSFALFDSASSNGFQFSPSRNIDSLVTAYIFRFFPQAINSTILNSVELATIFHLPDQYSIPTSQVQRQMSKQVDGPTETMEEGLLIGYNEFRGVKKPIRISDKDRRRHIHIIGQTGVGKSVLQENLAFQDMMDGRGFAFVDPHGDTVESLLAKVPKDRFEDVIYFNPSDMDHPIGLNMFEFEHPDEKDFLIQEAISMLYGLYDPGHTGIVGPRLEHIFRNSALLLMSDPKGGTFIDIPKLLVDPEFMKSKLKYVTDQQVLDFWTKEWPASQRSNEAGEVVSWVVSKFGPFISNDAMRNIIGQTKSSFNFSHVMDNNKILLVNLSKGKMGELNSKLLGIIFVMKFNAATMARAKILNEDDRKDFTLYVDEFQNFATDSFSTILSEARKYRLSLVLANQFMTQLKEEIREAIIGNVGTSITGRIGITDAEIMVKRYVPVFDAEDLTKLPNFQYVSVAQINGVPSAPFSMNGAPPMGHANPQLSDALKRLSAAKYARPRGEVEKEIFSRIATQQSTPSKPQVAGGGQVGAPKAAGSGFLDEWLAKRKQLSKQAQASGMPTGGSSASKQLSAASAANSGTAKVAKPPASLKTTSATEPAPNLDSRLSKRKESNLPPNAPDNTHDDNFEAASPKQPATGSSSLSLRSKREESEAEPKEISVKLR